MNETEKTKSTELGHTEHTGHTERISLKAMNRKSFLPACAAVLLLSLLLLVLTSFAAVTYGSAEDKLAEGRKALSKTSEYYAAETTATEIISQFFSDKNESSATQNGIEDIRTDQGSVEVTKIDSQIYFSVPFDEARALSVGAEVTRDTITVTEWFVEEI